MADVKISALPASAGAAFADLVAAVDMPGLVTQKQTLQQVWDLFRAGAQLTDGAALSVDATNRLLVDGAAANSADWSARQLIDSAGTLSLNWENRVLADNTTTTSVDWQNRLLIDAGGATIFNWQSQQISDSAGNAILDWATPPDLIVVQGLLVLGIAFTVATLPAAGTAGRHAYVTDALAPSYGAAVVGGGAVIIPVFDDGVQWIVA